LCTKKTATEFYVKTASICSTKMPNDRKLSQDPVFNNLLERDRLVILRSPLDEPEAAKRNGTTGLPALAAAVAKLLPAGFMPFTPDELNDDKDDFAGVNLQSVLLKIINAAIIKLPAAPTVPLAPTAGVVDDTGDTFSFLPNSAYPSFAQYKVGGLPGVTGAVALDGTNSYVQGNRIYIKVVGAVAKGNLAVYVAGSGNVPDGAVLTNADPFTGVAVVTTPVSTAPTITGFNPTSAAVGASVTISGTGFTGATGVLFNGTASSFTVLNATTISVTVPAGATTGRVSVATSGGTGQSQVDFTVTAATTTPTPVAQPVAPTLSGFNDVDNTLSVSHATLPVSELVYDFDGATGISVPSNNVVSVGNKAGQVTAYARANGTRPEGVRAYSQPFTVAVASSAPTVSLSSPQAGQSIAPGQPVVLNASPVAGSSPIDRVDHLVDGQKFAETTATPHTVQYLMTGGAHSFTARVYDMVGASGLSNAVAITGTSAPVQNAPNITSFYPTRAKAGELVTLYGTDFTGADVVKLGALNTTFRVLSSTQVSLTVPAGAVDATFTLHTPNGTATSAATFAVDNVAATNLAINVFSPFQGVTGTTVTLSGTAFGSTQGSIKFNGIAATVVSWADTQVQVTSPAGNATGNIELTRADGVKAKTKTSFLALEAGDYDILSAVYGEVADIAYNGFIEDDPLYFTTGSPISWPGTDENQLKVAYRNSFTPKAPSFGLSIPVFNSFEVGKGNQNFVRCVFSFNTGEEFGFQFEGNTGRFCYYRKVNGQEYFKNVYTQAGNGNGQSGIPFTPPYAEIGISICDLSCNLWIKSPGEGYKIWDHDNILPYQGTDFRIPSRLAQITEVVIYIGSGGNSGKNFNLGAPTFGYLKGVGTANYAPVTYSDGGYCEDGQTVLIGGSVAQAGYDPGIDAVGIHTCHAAIFELDIINNTMRQRAKVWVKRALADGIVRIMGENSTSSVFDLTRNKWAHTLSTWGTYNTSGENPVEPLVYETDTLPRGITIFEPGISLNFPKPYGGTSFAEDTDFKYFGGLYHWVYATNRSGQFSIHHVTSPTPYGTWTLVGSSEEGPAIVEGTKLVFINGVWVILATYAPGNIQSVGLVFGLNCRQIGTWQRTDLAASTSPTHSAPFVIQKDGFSIYRWAAFGGERFDSAGFSWGDMHVLGATRQRAGYDFPVRALPA
jgi:hypothetical protein